MSDANVVERLVYKGSLASRAPLATSYVLRRTRNHHPNAEQVTKETKDHNLGRCQHHINCSGHVGLFEGRPVHPAALCSPPSRISSALSNARNDLIMGRIPREDYDRVIQRSLLSKNGILRGHVTSLTVEGSVRLVIVPRKAQKGDPLNTVSIPSHVADNCKVPYWNSFDDVLKVWRTHEVRYSKIVTGDVGVMIRYPTLSSGSAIPVNIVVEQGGSAMGFSLELTRSYNADYDGDECVVCIVRTPEGVSECKTILCSSTRPFKRAVTESTVANPSRASEAHAFLWETTFTYGQSLTLGVNLKHISAGLDDQKVRAFSGSLFKIGSDEDRYAALVESNRKSVSKTSIQSNSGYLGRVGRVGASCYVTDCTGTVRSAQRNDPEIILEGQSSDYRSSYGIPAMRAVSKLTRKITQSSLTKKSAKDDLSAGGGVDMISELIAGCSHTVIYVDPSNEGGKGVPKVVPQDYVLESNERLMACISPNVLRTNVPAEHLNYRDTRHIVSSGLDILSLAGSFSLEKREREALMCMIVVLANEGYSSLVDKVGRQVRCLDDRNVRLLNILHSSWYNSSLLRSLSTTRDEAPLMSPLTIFEMCLLCNYSSVPSITSYSAR